MSTPNKKRKEKHTFLGLVGGSQVIVDTGFKSSNTIKRLRYYEVGVLCGELLNSETNSWWNLLKEGVADKMSEVVEMSLVKFNQKLEPG